MRIPENYDKFDNNAYNCAIDKLKKMGYKIYVKIEEPDYYKWFEKYFLWIAEKDDIKFEELDPLRLFAIVVLADEYISILSNEYDDIPRYFELEPVKE
jgi:hypothetical protein